jgi:hypothetical protein
LTKCDVVQKELKVVLLSISTSTDRRSSTRTSEFLNLYTYVPHPSTYHIPPHVSPGVNSVAASLISILSHFWIIFSPVRDVRDRHFEISIRVCVCFKKERKREFVVWIFPDRQFQTWWRRISHRVDRKVRLQFWA